MHLSKSMSVKFDLLIVISRYIKKQTFTSWIDMKQNEKENSSSPVNNAPDFEKEHTKHDTVLFPLKSTKTADILSK